VLDQILNEPASAAVEQTARLILSEEQSLRNRDVIRAGRTA
jgi:hypothetical protein